MQFIAFSFKKNVSEQVLKGLKINDKYSIPSSVQGIDKFISELIIKKPKYILGLGMYNRIDKDKLRIETHYSAEKGKLPINYFLTPNKNSKLAKGIGNSYCNYISAQIMKLINQNKLKAHYTFIHIPKTFQVDKAAKEIEEMLSKLNY